MPSKQSLDIDKIIFLGCQKANTMVHGVDGHKFFITAPRGFHFSDGTVQKSFHFNDGQHQFKVEDNQHHAFRQALKPTNDVLVFKTQAQKIKDVVHGKVGHTCLINAPHGYHFSNGSYQTKVRLNNGSHVFDVRANQKALTKKVTDTVVFKASHYEKKHIFQGKPGEIFYVNAPEGFIFDNHKHQMKVRFNNGTHVCKLLRVTKHHVVATKSSPAKNVSDHQDINSRNNKNFNSAVLNDLKAGLHGVNLNVKKNHH